jgi:glyoxylase I family protein
MFTLKRPVVDIAIICSNFEESLRFYRDLLGLEVALEIRIPESTARGAGLAPAAFRQVRLRAGETLIKLVEIPSPPPPRGRDFAAGVRWLTLIVEDVPATVARLQARGVAFLSQPVAAPDAKHVVCAAAPDGLLIEFVQLLDGSTGQQR